MGPKKTSRRNPPGITKHQAKVQQSARTLFVGYLRHGMALLLMAFLVLGLWSSQSVAADLGTTDCVECHGPFATVHGDVDHDATPGSGQVVLFADNDHDDAGWTGTKPYFAVTVDCLTCHNNYLPEIHSNRCSTCHPTPYDTLATTTCGEKAWQGGCQQGGCHTTYHEGAIKAHRPFAVPDDTVNDCSRCHSDETASGGGSWDVVQSNCLNCHASPANGYPDPPVTISNAQGSYVGTAEIDFSINENGKVGIGRTFYKLDGGEETSGSEVLVSAPGSHTLEFYSVDQFGKTELGTNTANFTIIEDSTPPTTTSNAQSSYYQGGIITLSATDDSALGVQNTFYSLDGVPAQNGTTVIVPTSPGINTYTLEFWSTDWSGNVENKHSVTFTVTSGSGTIRLVWWDCDLYPSQKPTGTDKANWTIYRDNQYGSVVATGSGASPGWSGINDIPILIGPQKYFVRVYWWDSYEGFYEITDFPNVYVTTPGQVVRLGY